jgi:hypothetical protein
MKKSRLSTFAVVIFQIICVVPRLNAQITAIPAQFNGNSVETWEEFYLGYHYSPMTILGGLGTATADNAAVWQTKYGLGQPGGIGLGPYDAQAHDGTQGFAASQSGGTIHFTFGSPVIEIGGYWGEAVGYPAATFSFYGAGGSLVGSVDFSFVSPGNDGTLEWQGWQFSAPIYSMDFSGYWAVNDSLEVTLVPEPRSSVVLLVAAVVFGLARHKRRKLARDRASRGVD